MKINVEIEYAEVESESGHQIEGICVTCKRCGHSVEVAGITIASARLGAVMLREECPRDENNFYDAEWWT